jgi:hypothetical protein
MNYGAKLLIAALCTQASFVTATVYKIDPREKEGFIGDKAPSEIFNTLFQITVKNDSDQELTIAARYAVKPAPAGMIGMPNPFVYKTISANTRNQKITFKKLGDGRLGKLEEVIIRCDGKDIKTFNDFSKKQTAKITQQDIDALKTK